MWKDAVNLFETYMGSGIVVAWFFISLIYLFIKEKDSSKRIIFLYFPVMVLFLYFNPLFVKVVLGIIGEEIYYRFLWIIPISMTIAYTAVCIWGQLNKGRQEIFAVLCLLLIAISGKFIYTNVHFTVADNIYHMPEAVVKICDAIAVEGREVTAAFPREMVQYVRQYDSTVCMPYGREVIVDTWGTGHPLLDLLSQQEISVEELVYLSKDIENGTHRPCNFIIVPEDTVFVGDLESHGIIFFDSVEGYNIYHDTTFYIGL